jgi:putative DNA primase/helicase
VSSSGYQQAPLRSLRGLAGEPTMSQAASACVEARWPVLALHGIDAAGHCTCGRPWCPSPGKHPLGAACPQGFLDATTDPAVVREWVTQYPRLNLGIRTGAPPDGARLTVVDVDGRHGGGESLWELERRYGVLPDTVEVLTGSLGRHLYFEAPEGVRIRSSAGTLASGLDVRSESAYIVAPPSRHTSGRRYHWEWSGHPAEMAPAPLPGWLLDKLTAPTAASSTEAAPRAPWVATLLHGGAPEGERNQACFRLAAYFRRYGLPTDVIAAILVDFAGRCRPALDEAEVRSVVAGVARRYEPGQEVGR